MEHKIGEIFEYNGEWYQCVNRLSWGVHCNGCDFLGRICSKLSPKCSPAYYRSDGESVIFKKLEKVGEPYEALGKLFQPYKLSENIPIPVWDVNYFMCPHWKEGIVDIEIKQNKEDMEENEENKYDGKMDKECIPLCDALNSLPDVETTESCCGHCKDRFRIFFKCKNPYSLSVIARVFNRRYSGTKLQWIIEVETHDNGGYDYFVHSVEAYENNTMMEKDISQLVENVKYWSSEKYKEHFINGVTSEEKKKLNLKPFDIQKAREGKPVCTRDGAKARIICFDAKSDAPIIALITADDGTEITFDYLSDGTFFNSVNPDNDLMMLPEKKEGWINIYKGGKMDADFIYPTKADALENIFQPMKDNYIDTIKVKWDE